MSSEPTASRAAQAPLRRHGPWVAELLEREPSWSRDFTDLSHEWRRLFSELFGTFLLVIVAAGAAVLDTKTVGGIGRTAEVVAPALLVLAVILFMGAVSGAHLNPVVSIAFALRHDFQWRRVPGADFTSAQAFVVETLLTLGLVSTILGTASTAQNIGPLSAVGVGAYIALAGLWAGPVSGASMNPARSLGPDLARGDFHDLWIYLAGPMLGALLAVAAAAILRGPGGGPSGSRAAQGTRDPGSTEGLGARSGS